MSLPDPVEMESCVVDLAANKTKLAWKHCAAGDIAEFVIERAAVSHPDTFIEIHREPRGAQPFQYEDEHGPAAEVGHYYRVRAIDNEGKEAAEDDLDVVFSIIPIPSDGINGTYDPDAPMPIDRSYQLKDGDDNLIGVRIWINKSDQPVGNPPGCTRSRPINMLCSSYPNPVMWASHNGNCASGLNAIRVRRITFDQTWCEWTSEQEEEDSLAICAPPPAPKWGFPAKKGSQQ